MPLPCCLVMEMFGKHFIWPATKSASICENEAPKTIIDLQYLGLKATHELLY